MSFQTSTVVITGASRGIGRNIALAFARDTDHALLLLARDLEALKKVKEECLEQGGDLVRVKTCDLTREQSIDRLRFPDSLPGPGVLINNAGTFLLKKLQETSLSEFEQQWAINVKGPFLLTHKWLPRIKEQERGLIVNISSLGALEGQEQSGAYSSSKHALLGYSRSLRKELQNTNIAVSVLNLGQTMSTSWEGVDVDPDELIDPADVGKLIVSLTHLSPRTVVEEMTLRPQKGDRSPD
ncbi:MAG: SDR family oxidoreductase, partial [Balneolaceae bacterium]